MQNPFEAIEARLASIENLVLDLKHKSPEVQLKEEEELLDVKEAAQFLRLSAPTVYTKVSKGELPVMKKSKRLYFSKRELLSYLKKGRKKTNEELQEEASNYIDQKS